LIGDRCKGLVRYFSSDPALAALTLFRGLRYNGASGGYHPAPPRGKFQATIGLGETPQRPPDAVSPPDPTRTPMGSVVQLSHRPARRNWQKPAPDAEADEATKSLRILVGTFGVTAIVMSAVVVAVASNTWTDVMVMSAFVIVFALTKIALADALFYVMIRSDAAAEASALAAKTGAVFRRPPPMYPRPGLKPAGARSKAATGGRAKLTLLAKKPPPRGPARH
jgi:hypothetical protein